MTSINNNCKVHFGETSIHSNDCIMTEAERDATWYTQSELNTIKSSARTAVRYVKYGTHVGSAMIHQTESIRGLEELLVANKEQMLERKHNVLLSTIEVQKMTGFTDMRVLEIKNALELYVQKQHKQAADMAKSRAQEDHGAAQEIYNEAAVVLLKMGNSPSSSGLRKISKQPSLSGKQDYAAMIRRQHGEERAFNRAHNRGFHRQSPAALSA